MRHHELVCELLRKCDRCACKFLLDFEPAEIAHTQRFALGRWGQLDIGERLLKTPIVGNSPNTVVWGIGHPALRAWWGATFSLPSHSPTVFGGRAESTVRGNVQLVSFASLS